MKARSSGEARDCWQHGGRGCCDGDGGGGGRVKCGIAVRSTAISLQTASRDS